jgi:hypothetical protein
VRGRGSPLDRTHAQGTQISICPRMRSLRFVPRNGFLWDGESFRTAQRSRAIRHAPRQLPDVRNSGLLVEPSRSPHLRQIGMPALWRKVREVPRQELCREIQPWGPRGILEGFPFDPCPQSRVCDPAGCKLQSECDSLILDKSPDVEIVVLDVGTMYPHEVSTGGYIRVLSR